jgi:hypothetical protein
MYYEQLSARKCNNLDEIDKFFESNKLPKLNHETNSPIFINYINLKLKAFAQKKVQA